MAASKKRDERFQLVDDATADKAYDERDACVDTAAMYARNAEYWQRRAEAAELYGAPSHAEAMKLREMVFQSLGEASVCWESMNGTGVFDSTRAKHIGERLCAALNLPVEADR